MPSSEFPVSIPALHQMKRARQKIVGVVAWDFQVAQIVDRAGVEIVSVGDSVGTNLWGHSNPLAVTMDEMIVVCRAVRRGVRRAIVSCDMVTVRPELTAKIRKLGVPAAVLLCTIC